LGTNFKNYDVLYFGRWGDLGDLRGRKSKEQTLVRTIVVLIRNTTWRCGKLEKSIVQHLYKRHQNFGKAEVSVKDIMINLNITGEKKDECLDALRRLEKRNIVKITPL
jgi:hypothetical protein